MATASWKVIKPPKLNSKEMNDELRRGMKSTLDTMVKMHKRTVKTWKHSVDFQTEQKDGATEKSVSVTTTDKIWAYVDKGTPEHIILPKRPNGRLAFQGTYKAKTTPGVIDAHGGGKSGPMVYSRGVIHPGTEARGFSEKIGKEMQAEFERIMGEALSRAAVKSYHGIRKL